MAASHYCRCYAPAHGAVAEPLLPAIEIGGQQAPDAANTPSQPVESAGAGISGGAPARSPTAAPSSGQVEQNPANAQSNFGYGGGPLIDAIR